MLEAMEPREFDERYVEYRQHPWGCEIEVASAIGAAICNLILSATETDTNKPTYLEPDHFIPKPESENPQVSSTDSYFAMMRRQIMRGS